MNCGKAFTLDEYINEIDTETWERISRRSCDRV